MSCEARFQRHARREYRDMSFFPELSSNLPYRDEISFFPQQYFEEIGGRSLDSISFRELFVSDWPGSFRAESDNSDYFVFRYRQRKFSSFEDLPRFLSCFRERRAPRFSSMCYSSGSRRFRLHHRRAIPRIEDTFSRTGSSETKDLDLCIFAESILDKLSFTIFLDMLPTNKV